jgi:hypothetical protein
MNLWSSAGGDPGNLGKAAPAGRCGFGPVLRGKHCTSLSLSLTSLDRIEITRYHCNTDKSQLLKR